MKRFLIAAITCLALTVGVSPAAADSGLGEVLDTVTQTIQQNTNTAGDATASNANGTGQSNEQSQMGSGGDASTGDSITGGSECCGSAGDATSGDAYGGDVTQSQSASNSNETTQAAEAVSEAKQILPVNVSVPVCVAKHCETGDVVQSNANQSGDAEASNENWTQQTNDQSQAGYGGDASTGDATTGGSGCCGSGGDATSGDAHGGDVTQSQEATNANTTSQSARAESRAIQVAPVNVNAPVCVAWSCSSGDAVQSNSNRSGDATASNVNGTSQSNDQSQMGSGGDASTGDATAGGGDATSGDANGGDVTQSQSASNSNETTQSAEAVSEAKQILPVNVSVPVCVAKHCETGSVRQSNANRSGDAKASNRNGTSQSNDQSQKGSGGDASTGDATTGGSGCCKHGWHPKPKPKPRCDTHGKHGKSGCDDPCEKHKPKPRPCPDGKHAGETRSGDATGGDVDQRQQAQNDNRTEQTATASSNATQKAPGNVVLGFIPWKRGPGGCAVC